MFGEGNDRVKSRLVTDNEALISLITPAFSNGTIKILNSKGQLVTARGDMFRNSTIYNTPESTPKKIMHLEDASGNMASIGIMQKMDAFIAKQRNAGRAIPIPTELEPYFSASEKIAGPDGKETINARKANYQPYLTFVNLVQTTDNNLSKKSRDILDEDNVKVANANTDDVTTTDVYDYQKLYGNQNPYEDINDDVAMPTIFVKMSDVDAFRQELSGTVIAPKYQLEAKKGSTRTQSVYIPTSNFSTNSDIPSQIDGSPLPTLKGSK